MKANAGYSILRLAWIPFILIASLTISFEVEASQCENLFQSHQYSSSERTFAQRIFETIWPSFRDERSTANKLAEKKNKKSDPAQAKITQEWMQRYHGLKVALLSISNEIPFDPNRFFNFAFELSDNKSPLFETLVGWMKQSSALQQMQLFRELGGIQTFENKNPKYKSDALQEIGPIEILRMSLERARADQTSLDTSVKQTREQLHLEARALFEQNRPDFIAEAMQAWRDGKIRLNPDGTLPYDLEMGTPNLEIYALAKKFETLQANFSSHLSREESNVADVLIKSLRLTRESALSDSHYQQLKQFRYTELITNHFTTFDKSAPIWRFLDFADVDVRGEPRYREISKVWWRRFDLYGRDSDESTAPAGDKITSQTSRSPLAQMYGPSAERVIYWPTKFSPTNRGPSFRTYTPDLTRFRIVENIVAGEVKSVEVLVNPAKDQPPVGFFFANVNGELVPAKRFNGESIERACQRCHCTAPGSNVMSFKPFFLKSAADFRAVGYKNNEIIEALRRY